MQASNRCDALRFGSFRIAGRLNLVETPRNLGLACAGGSPSDDVQVSMPGDQQLPIRRFGHLFCAQSGGSIASLFRMDRGMSGMEPSPVGVYQGIGRPDVPANIPMEEDHI